jgi:hypothetical protein
MNSKIIKNAGCTVSIRIVFPENDFAAHDFVKKRRLS